MKKIKVGILMGGISAEHEISLQSGLAVLENIDKRKFKPHKLLIEKNGNFSFSFEKLKAMDIIFIALHGKNGEDGVMQGFLETLKIPYTGPGVQASAICIDKYISKSLWKAEDLPTANFKIVSRLDSCQNYKLPFVLKPRTEGSSVGVSIINEKRNIKKAFETAQKFGDVLLEEYIGGRELTVGVLGSREGLKPLPIVEIMPKTEFYNYEAKYQRNDTEYIVPAKLPATVTTNIQNFAVKACEVVGIQTFSRVDFLLGIDNLPYILEINTIPGLTSHSLLPKAAQAAGINFEELITKMIKVSQEQHDHKK